MYSETNEWQGNWSRILLEFFVFMVIYTFGSAGAETLLTDAKKALATLDTLSSYIPNMNLLCFLSLCFH